MYRAEADEFHRDAGGTRVQTSKLQRTAEARRVFTTFPSSSSYSRTDEKVFLIFPAAVAEAAAALSPNSYSTSRSLPRSLARPLFLAPFKAGAVIAHGEADEKKREGAGGREGRREGAAAAPQTTTTTATALSRQAVSVSVSAVRPSAPSSAHCSAALAV